MKLVLRSEQAEPPKKDVSLVLNKALDTAKLKKKQLTDKKGRKTTRWVRGEEAKPEKKGNAKEEVSELDKVKDELKPIIDQHAKTFDKTMADLKKTFPKANVYGRVKDLDSAANKVFIRRTQKNDSNYGIDNLQDLTGTRIEPDTIDGVFDTVKKLRKMYDVIDEDDYITHPKGEGYRRYHCICKDKSGKVFEVQIGTKNQTTWADWCHDVYKPHTKLQKTVYEKNSNRIMEYARATAAYFYAVDTKAKQVPPVPPCTHEIKVAYGCLPIG